MTTLQLAGAQQTETLGICLAQGLQHLNRGAAIALEGELGAGKTTLARALIRALGHAGAVVSPSYTLVEPYVVCDRRLLHLDLYRIGEPEELEYLGCREWDTQHNWVIAEWPTQGAGFLPPFDLEITLKYTNRDAINPLGRVADLQPLTAPGETLLDQIKTCWDEKIPVAPKA